MSKNLESKRYLPTYTAPQEILNSMQLEENNEVVADLNKNISESFPKKKLNSKYKRDISPERIDPLQNLKNQNDTQNLNQRSYKEIMLEQKKKEEREKNLRNRISANEKSKQYNNINYNSRSLYLNPMSRKETTENNSIYTKETKWKSDANKYEINENEELLSRKRKKDIDDKDESEFERPMKKEIKDEKLSVSNNNINYQDNNDDMSQSSEIVEEKEEFKRKGLDEFSSSSENYDIPTPKNESGNSSESEETLINEKNLKNRENDLEEKEENRIQTEKSIQSEQKSKKDEENKKTEDEPAYPKVKEDLKYNIDYIERNRPLTDEEINAILPGEKEGYQIVPPPIEYQQKINTYVSQKIQKYSSDPLLNTHLFDIPEELDAEIDKKMESSMYTGLKPEDRQFFQTLFDPEVDETKLSSEAIKKRKVLAYLLKIKNGIPPVRKNAMRQLAEKSKYFGPSILFSQIIPLLMSPSIDDEERHSLVKLMERLLLKLGALVRPWAHKILVAVTPMLVDDIPYVRIEGREIISNLSKSVGMPTMISVLRPDIESLDESIRTITAKSLAIVASSLGVNEFFPFLKAINETKKNWTIRETGIKTVQQLAMLIGNGVLPYLQMLIEIIQLGLKRENEHKKVKLYTALAISSLAEASYPYGIDFYKDIIKYLFEGIKIYKGKLLASYFKALGNIIILMDDEVATRSAKIILPILKKDFVSPDENIRRVILHVLKQCLLVNGIDYTYVKEEICNEFFANFWNRRMALDRKNYKGVIDVTVELAKKISCSEVLNIIVYYLKDENEIFRKMTLECVEKIVSCLGVIDIDKTLEQHLIDGLILCFEEQNTDENNNNNSNDIVLSCFGQVVNAFETRIKPYLPTICAKIQWRFSNKFPKVRKQSADLIVKLANSLKLNGEEALLSRLGLILDENLGEEYPEVLGSILKALKALVLNVGMNKMVPPIRELLPKLTPILRNRNDEVEENVVSLIGLIAEKGASYVSDKEWMRICFDLLELFKAHRKCIRRNAVNTFGHIAKAIGPQDVLIPLLDNLKIQERQDRICTTVAIAIIAEACGPFTVVPALLNEYRVTELNVQNGVLKALAFMFEYIGEMSRDYIYSILSLLQNALTERELVHRQQACGVVKHLAINVAGLNCEDALIHLLNYLWPNIFEDSPHFQMAFLDAIEGLRIGLGVNIIMKYLLQGLFHPAKRVREPYWKVYNLLYIGAQDDMCMCFPTLPDEDNTLGENDNFENKDFIDGKIVKDENEDEIELKLVKPFNRYETVELNLDL